MNMAKILIAEDDATLRAGLAIALESEGYAVRACADGGEALAAYSENRPDLILLDVMMPVKSGYDVCVEIRRRGDNVPIIFLTAKSSEEDVVLGLGLGADDFIAKPLRLRELFARISAALRRGASAAVPPPEAHAHDTFAIGSARVDARKFLVTADGASETLTVRELALLREFAEHPGEVLSRADLLESVWGLDYAGTTRTLDQHIVQIRRKLGRSGDLIETVRGTGYRLLA